MDALDSVAGSGRFMLVLFGCGQLLVNYLYSTPPLLLNLFYFVLSLFKSFLASPRFSAGIRVVVPHSRVFGVNPASISCLLRSTGKLCCLDYSVGDNSISGVSTRIKLAFNCRHQFQYTAFLKFK